MNHCEQQTVSELVLLVPLLLRLRQPGADATKLGPAIEEENWSGLENVNFGKFRENIQFHQDKRKWVCSLRSTATVTFFPWSYFVKITLLFFTGECWVWFGHGYLWLKRGLSSCWAGYRWLHLTIFLNFQSWQGYLQSTWSRVCCTDWDDVERQETTTEHRRMWRWKRFKITLFLSLSKFKMTPCDNRCPFYTQHTQKTLTHILQMVDKEQDR